jgi:large subunit ribosomal protein L31
MKKDIHPKYNEITVTLTNGEKIKMYSASDKNLSLDIDPLTHPAWTGGKRNLEKGGQVEKFNKRFAAFTTKKN